MNKKLQIGIVGLSKGNGHPYSWAAICNGYNPELMKNCPFPAIPEYLAMQQWPKAKIPNVEVTHIWTQDLSISENVAKASLISKISGSLEEMATQVDAILFARDDAENHEKMVMPFLKAGLPIFIDKPLALDLGTANRILQAQSYESQVFSCSSLRFADELILTKEDLNKIGEVTFVEAQISKYWETYSVHLIEPMIRSLPQRGKLVGVSSEKIGEVIKAKIRWENVSAFVSTYAAYNLPIEIKYFGTKDFVVKRFHDSFSAFKKSIEVFLEVIEHLSVPIPREETLEIIEIIEKGRQ
ncbi:MAG: hypothetical protein DHS20C18_24530 [Saprospiraceae bacterium]|nr:MAG: hypothetical protein DHS20C18_24530 [Saprospiraceae bacterium]